MTIRIGMRLRCATCGAEVIITKAGTGQPSCCGEEMQEVPK